MTLEPPSPWAKFIRYFPWMLFQKWVIGVVLMLVCFVFFQLAVLRLLIRGEYTGLSIEALVFLSAGGLMLAMIWWQHRFLAPMARIMEKSKSLAQGDESADLWLANPYRDDEDDEYLDLETHLNVIHDLVSESRESAMREREGIQTLVRSSGDAILAVGKEGNAEFYNSRFESLFGQGKLVKNLTRLSDLFREPELLAAFEGVLTTGASSRLDMKLIPSGATMAHFYVVTVTPLIKPLDGGVYGALGTFHDMTDLKRAELLKVDFVANVSHELRTPLTSIKGYLQALREDLKRSNAFEDSDTGKRLENKFSVVTANVDRMISLVSDLLDLSVLEAGGDLEMSDFDVNELTAHVLSQLEGERRKKGIQIQPRYEVGSMRADSKRIEQVLMNLVQNAIKYISESGEIRVIWESAEDGGVILKVADNGPGIAPEHQTRIFERFYRVDTARSRELGGTGLGLAIVKHIVQRHHGTISVKSEVGKGAEFICRFPPSL